MKTALYLAKELVDNNKNVTVAEGEFLSQK